MTHADRAYTAPQELADIRQEFKPDEHIVVDGVAYQRQALAADAIAVTQDEGLACLGCAAEHDTSLCRRLPGCADPISIFIRRK